MYILDTKILLIIFMHIEFKDQRRNIFLFFSV